MGIQLINTTSTPPESLGLWEPQSVYFLTTWNYSLARDTLNYCDNKRKFWKYNEEVSVGKREKKFKSQRINYV